MTMHSWQLYTLDSVLRFSLKRLVNIRRDLRAVRVFFNRVASLYKLPPGILFQEVTIETLKGMWITPHKHSTDTLVLYLHGGGFCMGSVHSHKAYLAWFSHLTGCPLLVTTYRLAPEHPFPAALEDSITAYSWLIKHKMPFQNIILAGESAGGGLCLSTLVYAREHGLPLPTAAVCISPWLDLAHTGESFIYNQHKDALLSISNVLQAAAFYYQNNDPYHPLISPLYADLSGLPPLLIQVSNTEMLLSDSLRVTDKAKAHAVNVTLEIWKNMPHAWPYFAPILPEARKAILHIKQFIDHLPTTK
jgi:acetyl esterase/lipase